MSFITQLTVSVTTDSSGDATEYTAPVRGYVDRIVYTKTDFATGVDFDITAEDTGEEIWDEDNVDASETVRPRVQVQDTVGGDLSYDATEPVAERICLKDERIKIVVANGGDTKTGTFDIFIEGSALET